MSEESKKTEVVEDVPKEEEVVMEEPEKEEELEDVTEAKDGGVMKKIVKEGEGWKTPPKGAEVEVHYTGKLENGEVFDSSRTRDEPFTFKLGVGQVIKGWDLGVKTMKKGENAIFTIKSDYGYGDSGSPPKIPGGAVLIFDVELISWNEEKKVTDDGGVLKKVISEGEGWERPKEDATATITYTAKIKDTDTVVDQKENFSFVIDAEEVIDGLDKAVQDMKKGEKAWFLIQPQYAYGETGSEELKVPPNTTLEYEIVLVDFTKEKASWEMTTEEKFEACKKTKDEGNELFKFGKYKRATKKYKKAIDYLSSDYSMEQNEKDEAKKLKIPCQLNQAACLLKMQEYIKAIKECDKVLDEESQNVKALFRRAQANFGLQEWDIAYNDLTKALEIEPKNKAIRTELVKVKRKQKEQAQKDKAVFSKMFKTSKTATSEATSTPKNSKIEEVGENEEVEPMQEENAE